VLVALDVRPGDQVLASVVVDTAELHLFAVADALQLLTGALPTAAPHTAPVPAQRTPGSRVRGRWQPADGGAGAAADARPS
jgi:hypothetical protein